MNLEAIKFVTEQDKASKDTLFLFHFLFQSNLVIKNRIMSHGGGGVRKAPKKCHVLFEWPLTTYFSFEVSSLQEILEK
jgi:hypothetical protein